MSVAARVSLILAVQEHTTGPFPAVQTYPAAYERRVVAAGTKVFAATGVVAAGGTTLAVAETLVKVHYWVVENLAPPDESGVANVIVAGAPVNGTVPRGQVVFATNESDGWAAAAVTITGTTGTPYKVIAVGE